MRLKSKFLDIANFTILIAFFGLVFSGYHYFEGKKLLTKANAMVYVPKGFYGGTIEDKDKFKRKRQNKTKTAKLKLITAKEGLFYTSSAVLLLIGIRYVTRKKTAD